jgi:hypothetical protein
MEPLREHSASADAGNQRPVSPSAPVEGLTTALADIAVQDGDDKPCSACQDLHPDAIRKRRRVWTGSLSVDWDAVRGAAVPNGECYACYLLLSAIESLKLEPHLQISSLEVNGEPMKGETLSVTVSLDGTPRRETLEFYCVQGK